MSKSENEQRFKRDIILDRVKLHLAQQQDMSLALDSFRAINQAYSLVSKVHMAALEEDRRALGMEKA